MKFTTLLSFALVSVASAIHMEQFSAISISSRNATVTAANVTNEASEVTDIKFNERNITWPSKSDKFGGFQKGQRFQLKSRLHGNKVLYIDSQPIGNPHTTMRPIKIREPEGRAEEFWTWDYKSQTIRSITNNNLVLAFESDKG